MSLTLGIVFPEASACPTPPGDCVDNLPEILPDFLQDAPQESMHVSTNVSFSVGSTRVWANLSANATSNGSSDILRVAVGVPVTLRVTLFPSNGANETDANVWTYGSSPSLYWRQSAHQIGVLGAMGMNETVLDFEFLVMPGAPRDMTASVKVTIGNETRSDDMRFQVDEETVRSDFLPLITFVGGLLVGVVLVALIGRRTRRSVVPNAKRTAQVGRPR